MDVDKKVLKHILMNFMDDLVENYFVFNQPLIKKDDNIYYDRNAGFGIQIKEKQYKVIKEFDVVVIL